MEKSVEKSDSLLALGAAMVAFAFVPVILHAQSTFEIVVQLAANVVSFLMAMELFRIAWSNGCSSVSRIWSGVWFVACGLTGLFLTLSTGYVDFGPASRPGYEYIWTAYYGESLFFFFGGIIYLTFGTILFVRACYLNRRDRTSESTNKFIISRK